MCYGELSEWSKVQHSKCCVRKYLGFESLTLRQKPRICLGKCGAFQQQGGYVLAGFVLTFIIGIVCILLGISHRRGNISSLHSYHTHRVSEEDKPAFGKLVGLGTIIMGGALIVFSILAAVVTYTAMQMLLTVGYAVMIEGFVVGLGISFYAMIKYNKGIF